MGITMAGTWASLKHFKRRPPHLDAPFGLYPVSVLKPLKGAENGMKENLKSFFRLDYPKYEIIFSVAEEKDPACQMVRRLIEAHPDVDAHLIVGDVNAGPNPKVNNLIRSYERAQFDLLLISDSNVRVEPDYLKRLVAHIENGVGMVTSVVSGQSQSGIGGHLEATFLNTFYARSMLLLASFGRPCVVGKSMLFRRSTANRFGGIANLARYLAEDYMAGEAMRKLNLRVVIASDPVHQHIGHYSFKSFWSRHLRWGRIRKAQEPLVFAFEPLFGSWISGLIGAFALNRIFGLTYVASLALHLLIWSICDLVVLSKVEGKLALEAPLVWLMREFLAFPLWVHIALGNTVNWRGNRLRLQSGGIIETVSA